MFTTEDCYNRETFLLQCLYGKKVFSYKWNLVLGITNVDLQERLFTYGQILQIIINYDARDIGLGTNVYNKFTEKEIYNMVLSLKNKLS